MRVLGIETTGAFASVALMKDNGEVDVIHGNDRFSHLQNLTPQIKTILDRNNMTVKELDAIAVSSGPGSFTGIRIGVSTARAMSQMTGVPCVSVSSLEALAMRCGSTEPLICPILDARRSQVYGGGYRLTGEDRIIPEEVIPAGPYLIEEFLEKIEDHAKGNGPFEIIFFGDGIDTCGEKIEEWAEDHDGVSIAFAEEEIRYQDALTVVKRAEQLLEAGKSCGYMELEPNYMRMAEAERKLRMKQAAEKAGEKQ